MKIVKSGETQPKDTSLNIVAMIPARGGSKGIINKNMQQVHNKPLIGYTIEAAQNSKTLSAVVVSTDSVSIREYAIESQVEAPFLRPKAISEDKTCMLDVMHHFVDFYAAHNLRPIDLLVTLYPTSPFRTGTQIDEAVNAFLQSDAQCLVSVSAQKHHPYWSLKIDDNNFLSHYFDKDKLFYRRQDMPTTYEQNGAIYIVRPEDMSALDIRSMAERTLAFVMDGESGINIDTEHDLILADSIASKHCVSNKQ